MSRHPHEWPNLFLVGVVRGGTTSLWGYLDQHPEIYMATVKEPHYFTSANPTLNQTYRDDREYLTLFAGAHEPIRGEASASYFGDSASPAAIRRASPDAKILVIFRDPVERAYSHYWHDVTFGGETRSFREAVQDELAGHRRPGLDTYVRRGFYSEPLRRYLDTFGENVYVLFLEDMHRDPAATLRGVFEFLGVDADVAESLAAGRRNAFQVPRGPVSRSILQSVRLRAVARMLVPRRLRSRFESVLLATDEKPPMAPDVRRLLESLYRSDEDVLERMLGRRLPWSQRTTTDVVRAATKT
jgi:hypothetical protein